MPRYINRSYITIQIYLATRLAGLLFTQVSSSAAQCGWGLA